MKFPLMKIMKYPTTTILTKSATALMIAFLAMGVSAQRLVETKSMKVTQDSQKGIGGVEMAVPSPVVVSGNPTCATLNASTDPAFAHITQDWGLKVNRDGSSAFNASFNFVNGGDTELQGGAAPSPGSVVHVQVSGTTLNWGANREITAVIVKGGQLGANVYPYNPASFGGFPPDGDGAGLNTGNQNEISHFVFCFESLAPTAAPASISGRVVDTFGIGIGNARLSVMNAQTGETFSGISNPFGYYTVEGMEVGNFYLMTISHKRFVFADNTRTFTLQDSIAGIDFTANP